MKLMMPKTGVNRGKIGKEKVALLRVPEDCTGFEADEKKSPQNQQARKKN
ncbi:hypothetical protein LVW35_00985 [Pseudomonas sp. HN11]|nr:hypothetical protein [Pseudomonas sp. HN11]UII71782.1 hypothetical protein LVW35_00985 [Pseudomonas sp. HN11]